MAYSENGMNEESMTYNENTVQETDGAYENTVPEIAPEKARKTAPGSVSEAETPAEAAETPAVDEQTSDELPAEQPADERPRELRRAVYAALQARSRSMASQVGDPDSVRPTLKFDEYRKGGSDGAHLRRRRPKHNRFLHAMLIYSAVVLLVIGVLACVGWKYIGMYTDTRAERYVGDLAVNTTADGWRQILRRELPGSYPDYEDSNRLAYEVLSPAFNVGKVTYIRRAGDIGDPVFALFSDGEYFASLELEDISSGFFGLAEWQIKSMTFDMEYFRSVDFPVRVITLPVGAQLYINDAAPINAVDDEKARTEYPAVSPAETGTGVAPCVSMIFRDIYYEPTLKATLDGTELQMFTSPSGSTYFAYPESDTHSLTVTVPEGVTVRVGGTLVTEEWCERESKEGELGALDDGGTGTRPMLSVWTVSGLFGDPEVKAEVYGTEVGLLSSEGGNFVFDTPAECKYTVTVIAPAGAQVMVNGRVADPASKAADGADMEEIGRGQTVLGQYEVSELSAVPEAVPDFDKYVLTGYLAMPNVTASVNGRELPTAGVAVNEYDVVWEFDCISETAPNEARAEEARDFARNYLKYICDGGAWEQPENAAAFDANYEALRSRMVNGTSGYVGIMESYREVNKLPHYDYYSVDSLTVDQYAEYTAACVSCRVNYTVSRVRNMPEGVRIPDADTPAADTPEAEVPAAPAEPEQNDMPDPEIMSGSIMVLQVLYHGEWRVWGFIFD